MPDIWYQKTQKNPAVHSQILKNRPNSYWENTTAEQIEQCTLVYVKTDDLIIAALLLLWRKSHSCRYKRD
jgi:hypothetical protein